MPRRLTHGSGGCVFHVLNRGVRRSRLFHQPADYEAFLALLCAAGDRVAMRVLAYALMPNHWHLVLWPVEDRDLTQYVGWLSLSHACRWQRVNGTRGLGHVYQGRYKAFPVEPGQHLLTVIRYVERNPVGARLVARAEDWPYCSASDIEIPDRPTVHRWPTTRPQNWLDLVNEPERDVAFAALRSCVARSAPFGAEGWSADAASRLGWTTGVRPSGRPRSAGKALRE